MPLAAVYMYIWPYVSLEDIDIDMPSSVCTRHMMSGGSATTIALWAEAECLQGRLTLPSRWHLGLDLDKGCSCCQAGLLATMHTIWCICISAAKGGWEMYVRTSCRGMTNTVHEWRATVFQLVFRFFFFAVL